MPPEDPSKLPDEPPDKSPLQSGQKSLPTDGETRSDELCPPPPDKSPDSSPDKSPALPSKTGRPTDENFQIIAGPAATIPQAEKLAGFVAAQLPTQAQILWGVSLDRSPRRPTSVKLLLILTGVRGPLVI